MSNIAIRVEGLGKMYRIGGKQERYRTLRDTLTDAFAAPFRRASSLLRGQAYGAAGLNETIWALKDVSFEVKHGEVVGIIGRNGAGKSTLLKILSRITEPTEGYADVYGRVGSLLEVGTGFHPELTGRENIYLNGAILGMSRAEIDRKFDEIVAFAEIEKFIDTPVKHYSSGMGLRLGFAVAAHLEPEILVVDEVLAVGDAQFQKKCLGKMSEVAEGRTVLFVSHNMDAVLSLCSKACVLDKGVVTFKGSVSDAVEIYYSNTLDRSSGKATHVIYEDLIPSDSAAVFRVEVLDRFRKPLSIIYTWDEIVLRIHYISPANISNGSIVLDIRERKGQRLAVMDSGLKVPIRKGIHHVDCIIPRIPLSSGEYYISIGVAISNSHWLWRSSQMGSFQVVSQDVFGIGRPPSYSRMVFAIDHQWVDLGDSDDTRLTGDVQ